MRRGGVNRLSSYNPLRYNHPVKFFSSRLVGIFVILDAILLLAWLQLKPDSLNFLNPPDNLYPEISELTGKNFSFDELKKYFTTLAEKKGAKYAYEVLKIAPIPPNTDMHLLGHTVGDVLYKQQGLEGIKICTEDFRNACSHSIVVGLLIDKGEGVLPDIARACRQAPGGSGAYTMCYHGLGHGVLAFTGYDFKKSVELCQKTGTLESGNQESAQCIGGMVMEIISGGGHDRKTWAKQRPKYLMSDNPFYPCAALAPNEAKGLCYTYITPYLWEAVGGDSGSPSPETFEKAMNLCNGVESAYKNICFGGFGKEFVVLAQNRDIRKIEEMTDQQLQTVYTWCQLAKNPDGIQACLGQALSSLFWGGENNRAASIKFCGLLPDLSLKSDCFTNLISQVGSYIDDLNYKKAFCQEIPENFKMECQSRLSI